MRLGYDHKMIHEACKIDPWFLEQIQAIVDTEAKVREHGLPETESQMRSAQGHGLFRRAPGRTVRQDRQSRCATSATRLGVRPVYKRIDTCAAEFASPTAYMYSTYETPFAGAVADEARPSDRKKVVILGGGPNRIGQGIEFDYCCCHAAFALSDAGYETIMVNCNPETVSTDYDTSDRLYFEPLTEEDVIEILTTEKQNGTLHGVIVQFGGQTPLNLAEAVERAGVPILGTQPDKIDLAEDRDLFMKLLNKLELTQPKNGIAYSLEQARIVAERLGYPAGHPPVLRAGRPRHGDLPLVRGVRALRAVHPDRAGAARHPPALPQRQDRPDQLGPRRQPAAVRRLSCRAPPKSTSIASPTARTCSSPASWSISRKPASTRATAPARSRPHSLSPGDHRRAQAPDRRAGPRAQGRRADERAVRPQGRNVSTSSRSTRAPRAPCPSSPRSSASPSPRSPRASWRAKSSPASISWNASSSTSPSRKPCSRSPASPASTPCSARK